ncbi:MAG: prepilin-type N-terminal cleavage/methylation domain-containing protein [Pseudomonas sp.]|uniref:prepilin-type N-terminal cleavage/methylation domain-containing protein n=1 Tax=Pseudomonas sp. TaxID=306 RepID=UPI002735EFC3|nr:prepilin-type N-terminal cleavage/methylation domain-containing protein [Pseudomonas sp.]MDP3845776.1 prepilin-type N-terminal cleavage/methylation domain-containing protein [Pseudomonas sp.]
MSDGYRCAQPILRAGASTRQRGMTLIELVIAIVIIGIASAALYSAMASITGRSADPMLRQQSLSIAEAYLEEIELQAFLDPSTQLACQAIPANRALFDDVCDYRGLVDVGAVAASGLAIAALAGYGVRVTVASPPAPTWNLLPSADVFYIQVTVTDPAGQDLVLGGYRTR